MNHPALPDKLERAWETSIGEGSARYTRVMSQPVIAGGRIFAMDGGAQVSALDAASGKSIWQVDLKPEDQRGSAFGGGPSFWKDRLYVATGYAEVVALDPADGKVVWRKNVTSPVHAPPTVADGRIFAVTVDNELDVLAVEDGRRLWSHNGIPETAGLLGGASPAVEGEIVIAPYSSGELFALRVENGRAVWSDSLAANRSVNAVAALADIRGRPVIDRGKVFAVSHSGRMAAIDLRSGERVWEQEIASSHSPWIVGDYVFVLANDNEVVCLTHDEGKVRWVRELRRYRGREGEIRPDLLGRPGARRQPPGRALLARRGGICIALHRRGDGPADDVCGRLSRAGYRRQRALLAERRRKSLRLSLIGTVSFAGGAAYRR